MPRPLTIAMLSIHSSPLGVLGTRDTGGMSVYVRALAREMGRAGHRVDIFTLRRHGNEPATQALGQNVRLVSLDIGLKTLPPKRELHRYAGECRAAVEAFRVQTAGAYDLIHSHYWISGEVGRRLGELWHRPHAVTFHTLAAMKDRTGAGRPATARRLAVEKALVRDADALLVACAGEVENLVRYHRADPERIMQVPGGVDFERFRPLDGHRARRQLGFDPEDFIILSVGRLAPLKGQERILEALALLGADANLKLVLVGGDGPADPEQRRLERRAARAGLDGRVTFTGSVLYEDLPAYYAAADVFVQASRYESFGLVGLEALACGRPVVTSPVGIMATLGERSPPGCLLTDGSPAELAGGIAAVRSRNEAWPPAAIRAAVRTFSWPQAADAALAAYHRAIGRHTGAGFPKLKTRPVPGGLAKPRSTGSV